VRACFQRVTLAALGKRKPVSDPSIENPRVKRTHALFLVAVCFAVVAVLGLGVFTRFGPQMDLDGTVSETLYVGDQRPGFLYGLLQVLTEPGVTLFRVLVFLPVVVVLLVQRRFTTALWVVIPILTIGPLNTLLKMTFGRVRPDFDKGGALLDSLSYPSGHSSGITTLVAVSLLLVWPLIAHRAARRAVMTAGVILVVMVGLTRMWLGVHFLSDVVGGWALGLGWTVLVATLLGGLPGHRAALPRRVPAAVE
jgi:membrane-associated phospholipid phosphatase